MPTQKIVLFFIFKLLFLRYILYFFNIFRSLNSCCRPRHAKVQHTVFLQDIIKFSVILRETCCIPRLRPSIPFLFSIANPTTLTSDYETTIDLYGDNNIISSISFSNDTCYEITDSLGNATELFFDTIAPICSYSDYKFKISSSAPTVENAYGFRLNNEGTIWNRLTYVLLTKDQQKLVYTLIFIILISFMYVILYILNRNFATPPPRKYFFFYHWCFVPSTCS